MADPPVAPYCSSSTVYYMVEKQVGAGQGDFLADSIPSKRTVDQWIESIASRINGALQSAGYYVPLQAMTGEAWPDWQTKLMEYFNAVGVASMVSDDPTSPTFVNLQSGVRKGISRYRADWNNLIDGLEINVAQKRIHATSLVRANARPGTNADYLLSYSSPPTTTEMVGYPDSSVGDMLREFTQRKLIYMRTMQAGHEPGADPYSVEYMRNARVNTNTLPTRQN